MGRFIVLCFITAALIGGTISTADASSVFKKITDKITDGLYLRGGIGFSKWNDPDFVFDNTTLSTGGLADENLDAAFLASVGVGYRLREFLRTDLTLDVRSNTDVSADSICGVCSGTAIETAGFGTQELRADLNLFTLFANAYIEPITFGRVTPYVGGGVGVAYVNYGTFVSSNNPTTSNVTDPGVAGIIAGINPSNGDTQSFNGDTDIRFAWNLQAGASYDLTDSISLDGSYRYIRVEGGLVTPTATDNVVSDDLAGHEVRLGLRYTFGSGSRGDKVESPLFK